MQTLLIVVGLLVVGLIALMFLIVFLKGMQSLNDSYGLEDEESGNKPIDFESFKSGLNQGVTVTQMSLYKMWVDCGETMVVGSFDNIQAEVVQNISQFFNDNAKMKEWNEKFLKYIETKSKEEPPK